jgi:hypothetical protein
MIMQNDQNLTKHRLSASDLLKLLSAKCFHEINTWQFFKRLFEATSDFAEF